MNRAQRLFKMMSIDDFRPEELDISTSDALTFLLNTHNTPSRHPRILALLDFLNAKIRSELELNIGEMLDEHKRQMDEIESRYE